MKTNTDAPQTVTVRVAHALDRDDVTYIIAADIYATMDRRRAVYTDSVQEWLQLPMWHRGHVRRYVSNVLWAGGHPALAAAIAAVNEAAARWDPLIHESVMDRARHLAGRAYTWAADSAPASA